MTGAAEAVGQPLSLIPRPLHSLQWKPWPLDTLWLHWQQPGGKGDVDGTGSPEKESDIH